MKSVLKEELNNGTTLITLNRPDRHNAIDDEMIKSLTKTLLYCEENPRCKLIIIKAQGENFCAGADLAWMQRMVHADPNENLADAVQLVELFKILYNLTKPTIALAQGKVLGGGIGLLACCDIVLAEKSSLFCFREAKIGLVPATIAPFVIASIGNRCARYYFLTAKFFDAKTAKEIGLIQEVIDTDLLTEGMNLATTLLQNGPKALSIIKKEITRPKIKEKNLQEMAQLLADVRVSKEAQEGLTAFIEKRNPVWNIE